jgi:hypothetical protein
MSLPLDVARCDGRTTRSMGQQTLCRECIKCARRTDRPAGVQLSFMEPPALIWLGTCSGYRPQIETEVAE